MNSNAPIERQELEHQRYLAAWRLLRRTNRAIVTALLLFGIGVLMAAFGAPEVVVGCFGFGGGILYLIAMSLHYAFACPRCGHLFFQRQFEKPRFGHTCVHCGLQRDSDFIPTQTSAFRSNAIVSQPPTP
jgi:hypothetical protein